jgi:preprotein translocase subunit YajC
MLNRGWITVCVLAAGLILAGASGAIAQTTQPAPTDEGDLTPVPAEEAPVVPAGGDANKAGDPNATGDSTDDGSGGGFDPIFFVLIGGVILMWVLMGRGRRKEEARKKQMLSNLKKGDKIQTIGGIIGTVIEVRPDEVTVKVDETNNVRMRFSRAAIHVVGGPKGDDDKDKDKK